MYRVKLSWWPLPNGPKVFTCGEAKHVGLPPREGQGRPRRSPTTPVLLRRQQAYPSRAAVLSRARQQTRDRRKTSPGLLFPSVPEREENTEMNKRDFSTNSSRLRCTGKQHAQLSPPVRVPTRRPYRGSQGFRRGNPPLPRPHGRWEQVRAPDWGAAGRPPDTEPPGPRCRSERSPRSPADSAETAQRAATPSRPC